MPYSQKHSLETVWSQPQAWYFWRNWRGATRYWECSVVTAQGAGFLGSTTTLLLQPEAMGRRRYWELQNRGVSQRLPLEHV